MLKILDLNYRYNNDNRQWFDLNNQPYQLIRPNFWNPPADPGEMLRDPAAYPFFDAYRDQQWDIVIECPDADWGANQKIDQVFQPKLRLQMGVWHAWEDYNDFFQNKPSNGYFITAMSGSTDPQLLWTDWCFNQSKSYYLNYDYPSTTQLQYYTGPHSYVLPKFESLNQKTKIFINPGKTYNLPGQRIRTYRQKIFTDLYENFRNLGHFGNTHYDPTLWMHAQHVFPDDTPVSVLSAHRPVQDLHGGKDGPIHNAYYRDTYISIYAETIEFGTGHIVSEKTIEPLIHGHFILPFSNFGFLSEVLRMGFKLPAFIDYSYDRIEDQEQRWQAYSAECHRLLNMTQQQWQHHWLDNQHIICYNQRLLHHRPYHTIDLESLVVNR